MDTAWSLISTTQQGQFLQATGLQDLPSPDALSEAQWKALAGIVGTEKTKALKDAPPPGGTLASPALPKPGFAGDWSSIMARVAEIQMKLGELQSKVATEGVKIQKQDIEAANKKEAERIQEIGKKLAKANKSGLLGKIFGWIGAVVGLIGAVVATVATGGAAAPALALAILGVGMMVLQETGAMEKIVEGLVKHPALLFLVLGPLAGGIVFGLMKSGVIDEDQAKMAIQIALAAAMLVASIAGMVASGGASATDAIFKIIGVIGQIAGGLAQAGAGASGVAQAAYGYEAAQLDADTKEIQAWLARLQAMMSEEMDRLQQIMDQMNAGVRDMSDVIAGIAQSHRAVVSHMGA